MSTYKAKIGENFLQSSKKQKGGKEKKGKEATQKILLSVLSFFLSFFLSPSKKRNKRIEEKRFFISLLHLSLSLSLSGAHARVRARALSPSVPAPYYLSYNPRLESSVKSVPLKNFLQAYSVHFTISDRGRVFLAGGVDKGPQSGHDASYCSW